MTAAHRTKGNLDRHIQEQCRVKMKTEVTVILLHAKDTLKTVRKPAATRKEACNGTVPRPCFELDLGPPAFRNVRN